MVFLQNKVPPFSAILISYNAPEHQMSPWSIYLEHLYGYLTDMVMTSGGIHKTKGNPNDS